MLTFSTFPQQQHQEDPQNQEGEDILKQLNEWMKSTLMADKLANEQTGQPTDQPMIELGSTTQQQPNNNQQSINLTTVENNSYMNQSMEQRQSLRDSQYQKPMISSSSCTETSGNSRSHDMAAIDSQLSLPFTGKPLILCHAFFEFF